MPHGSLRGKAFCARSVREYRSRHAARRRSGGARLPRSAHRQFKQRLRSTLPEDPFAIAQILFGQVAAFATIKSFFQLVGPASTMPIHVGLDWQMSGASAGSGSAFAATFFNASSNSGSGSAFVEKSPSRGLVQRHSWRSPSHP